MVSRRLINKGWKFKYDETDKDGNILSKSKIYKKIDIPHDWSIEDIPGHNSPFKANAVSQVSGGFTEGGTGWYRKHFTISADQRGRIFHLQFACTNLSVSGIDMFCSRLNRIPGP